MTQATGVVRIEDRDDFGLRSVRLGDLAGRKSGRVLEQSPGFAEVGLGGLESIGEDRVGLAGGCPLVESPSQFADGIPGQVLATVESNEETSGGCADGYDSPPVDASRDGKSSVDRALGWKLARNLNSLGVVYTAKEVR